MDGVAGSIPAGSIKRGQMIKAIILDVDDTILDFSRRTVRCLQETAKELSLKIPTKRKFLRFYGTPLKNMVKKFWPKANPQKYESLAINRMKKIKIKPLKGAMPTIKKLSKKYKLALLSSKVKILMNLNLKQIHLPKSLFTFVYSKEDVPYHKPDPRVFTKPLKKLELTKKEILFVGDSIFDYLAAKKAKLNFIAVLTGHYTKKDFQKQGLKNRNILKSIKDLPKWLNENNK